MHNYCYDFVTSRTQPEKLIRAGTVYAFSRSVQSGLPVVMSTQHEMRMRDFICRLLIRNSKHFDLFIYLSQCFFIINILNRNISSYAQGLEKWPKIITLSLSVLYLKDCLSI